MDIQLIYKYYNFFGTSPVFNDKNWSLAKPDEYCMLDCKYMCAKLQTYKMHKIYENISILT